MAVIVREPAGTGVVLLRLNRPDKLNALNLELRHALARYIAEADVDPEIRAIVITGGERAFAAGADIGELIDLEPGDPRFEELRVAWKAMASCSKPLIAAVRGLALGGGFELALQCDLLIAGEKARFGLPEPQVGIVPGAGGMQRLTRLAGRQQAMLWLLTGSMIDAPTALSHGIAAEVVPDERTEARAIEIAAKAASLAPQVVSTIKRSLRLSENSFLDDALTVERPWFEGLFGSRHQREGMQRILSRKHSPGEKQA